MYKIKRGAIAILDGLWSQKLRLKLIASKILLKRGPVTPVSCGRSWVKVDVPRELKRTVERYKSGWSCMKLNGTKGQKVNNANGNGPEDSN